MRTDNQIQKDVMEELSWEPFLNETEIGVAVKDGIVTLSGIVDTFSKKISAEKAAKRVAGVRAIAEDIQVGVSPKYRKTDTEIAETVLNVLKWNTTIPENKIQIKVENGSVKLEGEVEWEYQKVNARRAVENVTGVSSVINLITVKPKLKAMDIRQKITSAFHRNATIDADRITIEVEGNKVILSGNVRSFAEKDDAERAAWSAPGILQVESKLNVQVPELAFND